MLIHLWDIHLVRSLFAGPGLYWGFYMCNDCLFHRQWREEQAKMLSKKDMEEEEALKEMRNQAVTELQEWYSRHEEQLTQTKGLNRYISMSEGNWTRFGVSMQASRGSVH